MGKLTSTPDFVNDEGHQAHSYPDLLVNLGVVGLHGYPNIFYEALQHLKGKAVNSHTALALGFAGKTRPCPVKVHPPSHTTPQGAPLVPAPLPIATTAPHGGSLLDAPALATPAPLIPHSPELSQHVRCHGMVGPLSGGYPPLTICPQ